MKVAVVIPARLESARLPRKVLADIAGRPMLAWVWDVARRAVPASAVWVATDAPEIVACVEGFGGQAVLTAPHHASGTDRIAEAVERIDADAVVNLQGDQPLMSPAALHALIQAFADDTTPMATLVAPLSGAADLDNPARVKVVARNDGRALYFSRAPIPFDRDGDAAQRGLLHIGVYIYRKDFLRTFTRLAPGRLEAIEKLEQLRALEHGYPIGLVRVDCEVGSVDTPEDLEAARIRLASRAR